VKLRCPICKTERDVPSDFVARPFCSLRCKQVDLGNWLSGAYRISRPLCPEDLDESEIAAELSKTS
jgi:endogenous inhibitor of DNA gyrase (YacG/DUF329 family)